MWIGSGYNQSRFVEKWFILFSISIQKCEMLSPWEPEEKFVPQIWDDARTFHFFFSGKNGAPSLVLRDKGFFRAEYKDLWMQMIEGHFKSLCRRVRAFSTTIEFFPPFTHANIFPLFYENIPCNRVRA